MVNSVKYGRGEVNFKCQGKITVGEEGKLGGLLGINKNRHILYSKKCKFPCKFTWTCSLSFIFSHYPNYHQTYLTFSYKSHAHGVLIFLLLYVLPEFIHSWWTESWLISLSLISSTTLFFSCIHLEYFIFLLLSHVSATFFCLPESVCQQSAKCEKSASGSHKCDTSVQYSHTHFHRVRISSFFILYAFPLLLPLSVSHVSSLTST